MIAGRSGAGLVADTLRDRLTAEGYAVVPSLIPEERARTLIAALAETVSLRSGGVRNLAASVGAVAGLARSDSVRRPVEALLGPDARLVRSTLFDKTEEANWNVRWHQDVTIAVRRRVDVDGYGPWSVKAGVVSVRPPAEVLEGMVSVRVHLDRCDEQSGALRVIPRSHCRGILSDGLRADHVARGPEVVCGTERGGALLMRPLLLHASGPAGRPGHRRVVHLDFAATPLGGDLEWSDLA